MCLLVGEVPHVQVQEQPRALLDIFFCTEAYKQCLLPNLNSVIIHQYPEAAVLSRLILLRALPKAMNGVFEVRWLLRRSRGAVNVGEQSRGSTAGSIDCLVNTSVKHICGKASTRYFLATYEVSMEEASWKFRRATGGGANQPSM
eukprot:gnl/TRDRNA2_/TRDRNA2_133508_c0_seq1.p1 gnl/TRDRNA2_/TRDRNA2_133508_c0~~gnl/TRDRNA2_/TRDRNA2_133508_c0_seq1.p1  ORF type:complete len:145 (+),score=13.53 gnl/TRDRNA2_/TRDRNA2_133508_c0_seq1:1-435(+)